MDPEENGILGEHPTLSETQREEIRKRMIWIQERHIQLLDTYGLFDGGLEVNKQFDALNSEFEQLANLVQRSHQKIGQ